MDEPEHFRKLHATWDTMVATRPDGESDESLNTRMREAEQSLDIDHLLGESFDPQKKEVMMRIFREKERLQNMLIELLNGKVLPPIEYAVALDRLINVMAERYLPLLTAEQFETYFGVKPGESIDLPIDPSQIRVGSAVEDVHTKEGLSTPLK